MQRIARLAKIRAGVEAEYDRHHAAVWPEVLAAISESGIRNYSIFRHGTWLFSYFELDDAISMDEVTRVLSENEACGRWEVMMDKLRDTTPEVTGLDCWQFIPEVFHID